MMRWWKERRQRLWWKELRESYPVVLVGWAIVLLITYKLPEPGSSRYLWGSDFDITATAIFLFVALVLGVTAYAVEEEYETLEPLLAKPIAPNDILATKLGVRLGLITLSSALVGVIELATGAWYFEYGIPSPLIFERWLSGLTVMVCGLGLGFYFGKVLGKQITGLLSAILVFAAGWVLLTISPLSFLFEGESGRQLLWIRGILVPGLVGTFAILASIRAEPGSGGPLSRPAVAILALAAYAAISWSLTVVPPSMGWTTGRTYASYWTVRFGSPEAGLQLLLDRFISERASYIEDDPDSVSVQMIVHTNVYRRSMPIGTDPGLGSDILGIPTPVPETDRMRAITNRLTVHERLAAEKRSSGWIARCLEIARGPEYSEHHRMMALHLAGLAGHPELVESIAAHLQDPSLHVRIMAAYMLIAQRDPRGERALAGLLNVTERKRLQQDIVSMILTWNIDPGPDFASLMREWITAEHYSGDMINRRVAQRWYLNNGSLEDIDLVRRSQWLDHSDTQRKYYSPDDVAMWAYMEAWGYPDLVNELYRRAGEIISELSESFDEVKAIDDKRRQARTAEDNMKRFRYGRLSSSLRTILNKLADHNEPGVIDLWRSSRHLLSLPSYYFSTSFFITHLASLGEDGIRTLREITDDPRETPFTRFQASLILSYHGHREYDATALRLLELYRGSPNDLYLYWRLRGGLHSTFLMMIREGNLLYAGPIIEEAWYLFENRGRSNLYYGHMYRYARVGTEVWNDITVQVFEEATGRRYGWNLKAWKKWWDREGKALSTAGN